MPTDPLRSVQIRRETSGDVEAIRTLTAAAFAPVPYSDGSEPRVVERLRADGDLTVSLVAQDDAGRLVGHIAFSPVTAGTGRTGWYGLGPVSVHPEYQGRGIGSGLVRAGLAGLEDLAGNGCVLVGDPDFYARFGFTSGRLTYQGLDPALVQHLLLRGAEAPTGEVVYSPAFGPEGQA